VECYRRWQTMTASKTILAPTQCLGGPVINWQTSVYFANWTKP